MSLQVINSISGKAEYVLLLISVYEALHNQIEAKLKKLELNSDYVPFDPADYVDNLIALARIKVHLTQAQLADLLSVSQAYISKLERQKRVMRKVLLRVKAVIKRYY